MRLSHVTTPNAHISPSFKHNCDRGVSQRPSRLTANGSSPLAYQWQKNDSAIAGATSATYSDSFTRLCYSLRHGDQPETVSNHLTDEN